MEDGSGAKTIATASDQVKLFRAILLGNYEEDDIRRSGRVLRDSRNGSLADRKRDRPQARLQSVLPGSHIAVPSHQKSYFGLWHHGILIDYENVVHMFGENKDDARIRPCSVKEFFAGTDLVAIVVTRQCGSCVAKLTVGRVSQ